MSPAQVGPGVDAGLPESRVLIIGTGGTICMQEGPDGLAPSEGFLESAMAPRPTFNDMSGHDVKLQAVRNGRPVTIDSLRTPPTAHKRHIRYGMLEFDPLLDSSSIQASDWSAMAAAVADNYHLFDGFVILHGTDSLAYTASALSFLFSDLGKPVILTGSQAPIFALQSDAVDNLLGSLVIAGTFAIPEVSAASFEAFASPNCEPLARVNGLGIDVDWSRVLRPTSIAGFRVEPALDTAHVACLRVFPGIKPEMVDAVLHLPDIRGLILETFGMGNVPGGADGRLTRVIRHAVDRGVIVVNVSQCVSGFVSPVYAPGTLLGRAGVIFGLDLTPEAALAKLSYLLARPDLTSNDDIARAFSRSLRGELTEVARPTFAHPTSDPLEVAAARLTPLEAAFAALGYAIQGAEVDVVRQLLDGDASRLLLKTADYAGNTALHLAAVSGCPDVTLELLRRGAGVHERNRANNSPLFLATLSGNDACARLLTSAGAHLSVEEVERGPLAKYRRNRD
ncbi:ankyrin repeats (3 copies) domain-containing protein [Hirsutella rhossiliensis]|uniref:asparaginase n=1 Tax=Hirsutella rhossiliensis TaxID=111463 RepID=A0A9P8N139_9HYPO|nr:ankyrin repeats (3 copies) domain-containing protein [Hirsutella rhossiliensis]KAH0964960.1 ankyrin repeats (3 copies) domain-containing protein [Hirsutella rhossiliensis]